MLNYAWSRYNTDAAKSPTPEYAALSCHGNVPAVGHCRTSYDAIPYSPGVHGHKCWGGSSRTSLSAHVYNPERLMRSSLMFSIACCVVVTGACGGSRERFVDTTKGEVVPAATPAPALSLADIAGQWTVNAVPEVGEPKVTTLTLTATADTAGWVILYPPNPKPVLGRVVAVAGDSLVIEWGPYLSARRAGVRAMSHDVYRLIDGRLVGYSVSHYVGAPPDSVIRLRLEGTRVP